jgi:hypothetical protein
MINAAGAAPLQQPVLQNIIARATSATKSVLESQGYTILGFATQFVAYPTVQAAAQQVYTAAGHGYALLAAIGQPAQYVCVAPAIDVVTGMLGDIKWSEPFGV